MTRAVRRMAVAATLALPIAMRPARADERPALRPDLEAALEALLHDQDRWAGSARWVASARMRPAPPRLEADLQDVVALARMRDALPLSEADRQALSARLVQEVEAPEGRQTITRRTAAASALELLLGLAGRRALVDVVTRGATTEGRLVAIRSLLTSPACSDTPCPAPALTAALEDEGHEEVQALAAWTLAEHSLQLVHSAERWLPWPPREQPRTILRRRTIAALVQRARVDPSPAVRLAALASLAGLTGRGRSGALQAVFEASSPALLERLQPLLRAPRRCFNGFDWFDHPLDHCSDPLAPLEEALDPAAAAAVRDLARTEAHTGIRFLAALLVHDVATLAELARAGATSEVRLAALGRLAVTASGDWSGPLAQTLADTDPHVRWAAGGAFAHGQPALEVLAAMPQLDADARVGVMNAIGTHPVRARLRPGAPGPIGLAGWEVGLAEVLATGLRDPSREVRASAVSAAGRLAGDSHLPREALEELLSAALSTWRQGAGVSDPGHVERLLALLGRQIRASGGFAWWALLRAYAPEAAAFALALVAWLLAARRLARRLRPGLARRALAVMFAAGPPAALAAAGAAYVASRPWADPFLVPTLLPAPLAHGATAAGCCLLAVVWAVAGARPAEPAAEPEAPA